MSVGHKISEDDHCLAKFVYRDIDDERHKSLLKVALNWCDDVNKEVLEQYISCCVGIRDGGDECVEKTLLSIVKGAVIHKLCEAENRFDDILNPPRFVKKKFLGCMQPGQKGAVFDPDTYDSTTGTLSVALCALYSTSRTASACHDRTFTSIEFGYNVYCVLDELRKRRKTSDSKQSRVHTKDQVARIIIRAAEVYYGGSFMNTIARDYKGEDQEIIAKKSASYVVMYALTDECDADDVTDDRMIRWWSESLAKCAT